MPSAKIALNQGSGGKMTWLEISETDRQRESEEARSWPSLGPFGPPSTFLQLRCSYEVGAVGDTAETRAAGTSNGVGPLRT